MGEHKISGPEGHIGRILLGATGLPNQARINSVFDYPGILYVQETISGPALIWSNRAFSVSASQPFLIPSWLKATPTCTTFNCSWVPIGSLVRLCGHDRVVHAMLQRICGTLAAHVHQSISETLSAAPPATMLQDLLSVGSCRTLCGAPSLSRNSYQ